MVVCELCGASDASFQAVVEGSFLQVCKSCSSFGRVVSNIQKPVVKSGIALQVDEDFVVDDYGGILRECREKLGLSQKDFALRVGERESFIRQLEHAHVALPLAVARKLEQKLSIVLVQKASSEKVVVKKSSSSGLTIGDIIESKQT